MSDLPAPLVPAEVDCTDLDCFMLNVERLMASELVALSSHEVIGAALMLWCRAWKQRPAASLPNDDKVVAAFARMPLQRFKKLRGEVLRGFQLCADGRLYHRTLAREAVNAFERKFAFQRRREADAERLRKWRSGAKPETPIETPNETANETAAETQSETRFVREGQGQGQGQKRKPTPAAEPPGFVAFWSAWPSHHRKADRAKCLSRWKADACEQRADEIVAKVQGWTRSHDWTKDDGQFIPAPAVWLNQRRYDAPLPAANDPQGSGRAGPAWIAAGV